MKRKKKLGWLGMDKSKEILRLGLLAQLSYTAIAASCGVTRQTVRNYLSKAKALKLTYEEAKNLAESELKLRLQTGVSGRKAKELALDYDYLSKELSKKAVTLRLLWEEELKKHESYYSYSRFCGLYTAWKKQHKLELHIEHKAAEKVFIDYTGVTVPIYNATSGEQDFNAQIFVACLGVSNYTFAEATRSQQLGDWLNSHIRMLDFFGGVPEVFIIDNLRSGVTKASPYEPVINRTYQDLAEHYSVAVVPARVRKPKDKAKVEKSVQVVETRILAKLRHTRFFCLSELNSKIRPLLKELNDEIMKSYGKSRSELYLEIDKPVLKTLPAFSYQIASYKKAKVQFNYHVQIGKDYFSVPYQYVGNYVEAKITETAVEITLSGKRIAFHIRSDKYRYHTCDEHMPNKHKFMLAHSPDKFIAQADKIGINTKHCLAMLLQTKRHPEQAYKQCLGILHLAYKYGNKKLELACGIANNLHSYSYHTIEKLLKTGSLTIEESIDVTIEHQNIRGIYH